MLEEPVKRYEEAIAAEREAFKRLGQSAHGSAAYGDALKAWKQAIDEADSAREAMLRKSGVPPPSR